MSEFFEAFKKSNSAITSNEILDKFLTASKEDISFRTHLTQPLAVAILETIRDALKQEGYVKTAKVIDDYVYNYKCDMVSYNRLSRIEVSQTLGQMLKPEIPQTTLITKKDEK